MAKEFYITLNLRELNAIMGIDPKVVAAYLFIKRNIDFSTGKTKHICFGALAVYLGNMDRTQAKRLLEKMIKLGLISPTDTKQIYNVVFCDDTENDTITTNKLYTLENTTNTKKQKSKKGFSGKEERQAKSTQIQAKQEAKTEGEGDTSQTTQKEGKGALTPLAAHLKKIAISRNWLFAGNSQSDRFYNSAASLFEKKNSSPEEIIATFEKVEEEVDQPRPLDLCSYQSKIEKPPKRSLAVGDFVL